MAKLTPRFEDVQAHYDLSDDFFRLFLDPDPDLQLRILRARGHDARRGAGRQDRPGAWQAGPAARHDAARHRLRLGRHHAPGRRTLRRQRRRADLSQNQADHVEQMFAAMDSPRTKRVLLEGWEQFDEPVDRIVSIGAFEHFGHDRYDASSRWPTSALPADGVMLLHTITRLTLGEAKGAGDPAHDRARPVLQVHHRPRSSPAAGCRRSDGRGARHRSGLRGHPRSRRCSRTTQRRSTTWAAALEASKDEAIEIQSEEVYDRYMKYLTGCADMFRKGLSTSTSSRCRSSTRLESGRWQR